MVQKHLNDDSVTLALNHLHTIHIRIIQAFDIMSQNLKLKCGKCANDQFQPVEQRRHSCVPGAHASQLLMRGRRHPNQQLSFTVNSARPKIMFSIKSPGSSVFRTITGIGKRLFIYSKLRYYIWQFQPKIQFAGKMMLHLCWYLYLKLSFTSTAQGITMYQVYFHSQSTIQCTEIVRTFKAFGMYKDISLKLHQTKRQVSTCNWLELDVLIQHRNTWRCEILLSLNKIAD